MDESSTYWRQLDICSPEKLAFPITVIGAGAIGSAVALNLAKMGCSDITVFDHDDLEPHNAPNQMCRPDRIGKKKVAALADLIRELCGVEIVQRPVKYVGQRLSEVVIVAVDSMDARNAVWKAAKDNVAVNLLIDGRMGAEVGRVHTVRPCDLDSAASFEKTLYPRAEAEQLPCSARAIIYCPSALAAVIASLVKRYAVGEAVPREVFLDLAGLRIMAA